MALSDTLVRLAYRLQASRDYAAIKGSFRHLLTDPRSQRRAIFDAVMIVLVLVSVFLPVYAVRHELGPWANGFEAFVVAVFVIGYLLRLWLYSDSHQIVIEHWERAEIVGEPFRPLRALWAAAASKLAYVATPMAIIDLLAILPGYRPCASCAFSCCSGCSSCSVMRVT